MRGQTGRSLESEGWKKRERLRGGADKTIKTYKIRAMGFDGGAIPKKKSKM